MSGYTWMKPDVVLWMQQQAILNAVKRFARGTGQDNRGAEFILKVIEMELNEQSLN